MRRFRSCSVLLLLAVCLGAIFPSQAARKKKLPARVSEILSEPEPGSRFWGIEIRSLDTGVVLYSQNADKLFTPASNTKLLLPPRPWH